MWIMLLTLHCVLLTGEACKEANTEFRPVFHRQKSTYVHARYLCCVNIVCPGKRDQNVYCNIFYKTQVILMKCDAPFSE